MKKILIVLALGLFSSALFFAMTDPNYGRSASDTRQARGSERAIGGPEPSQREIENAVQVKMERVVERMARSTGATPRVDTTTNITGCSPYGEDRLCQLRVTAEVEGQRMARDYTMRLMKTSGGWVERDDDFQIISQEEADRRAASSPPPSPPKKTRLILLAEAPSINDAVVKLSGKRGTEFVLAREGANPEIIMALEKAQAGDCVIIQTEMNSVSRSATDILAVNRRCGH